MQSLVLSVLLMGLIPVWGGIPFHPITPGDLSLASPSPLLAASIPVGQFAGGLSASGMIIVDLESGQRVAARNHTAQLPMASLTKLMTALLIVEGHDLKQEVQIPSDISRTSEGTEANLIPGEHFTVGDLLSAMLVGSANDAAYVLARFHSGSDEAFVAEMNARAKELGLQRTSFGNPSGLDTSNQWSTAQDIAWLASFVLRKEELSSRMSKRGVTIVSKEGTEIVLTHTHTLMHTESPVIAGKTGTTLAAGQCLLSLMERDGRQYLIVLLHSEDRYSDMQKIFRSFDQLSV